MKASSGDHQLTFINAMGCDQHGICPQGWVEVGFGRIDNEMARHRRVIIEIES
ncbi:hypothetical protein [Actinoplanes sp. NPDC051859]|uniref:hypothetical protein n=1 Tax=Actinoplanes sp. NPDC051859 TaxID=3363909 RepID=UPI00378AB160